MQVEAINVTGSSLQQLPKASDTIEAGRKELAKGDANLEKSSSGDKTAVQPEEILNQIKGLTENGQYSVRFENSQEFDELVVKVVDTETDEVIRQVPAEDVLGMKATLEDLRGQIVNTSR
ncbi:flagellar protein FlaG [Desulforhopalus sp. 52FAK]